MHVFRTEAPQTIALIRAELEANNRQRAAELLHRLRGSSLSIGAVRLAHSCAALEHNLGVDQMLRSITTLVAEYTLVTTALDVYLAERKLR